MSGGLCLTLIFVASFALRLTPLFPKFVLARWRCLRRFRRELIRGGVPRRTARRLTRIYREQMSMGELLRWAGTWRRDSRE